MATATATPDTLDPEKLYRAWQAFSGPAGPVLKGEVRRGNDPLVTQAPTMYVDHLGVTMAEQPSEFDQVIAQTDERNAAQEAAVREEAKRNRVTLEAQLPAVYKTTRDIVSRHAGRPATIVKGSTVLEDHPLRHEAPADAFRQVRP